MINFLECLLHEETVESLYLAFMLILVKVYECDADGQKKKLSV